MQSLMPFRKYWMKLKQVIFVNRTMCYIQKENGCYFETYVSKTACGKCRISMLNKCIEAFICEKSDDYQKSYMNIPNFRN